VLALLVPVCLSQPPNRSTSDLLDRCLLPSIPNNTRTYVIYTWPIESAPPENITSVQMLTIRSYSVVGGDWKPLGVTSDWDTRETISTRRRLFGDEPVCSQRPNESRVRRRHDVPVVPPRDTVPLQNSAL